jgi:hypothetical protein
VQDIFKTDITRKSDVTWSIKQQLAASSSGSILPALHAGRQQQHQAKTETKK